MTFIFFIFKFNFQFRFFLRTRVGLDWVQKVETELIWFEKKWFDLLLRKN